MKLIFSNLVANKNRFISKEYDLWTSIHKTTNSSVSIIDRSGYSPCPINYEILEVSKIPTHTYANQTYEEIIANRCQELMSLGQPLTILWSGGIDSTLIVASFLKQFDKSTLQSRIKIAMTADSIAENPVFYKNFILPNFELVSSETLPYQMYDDYGFIVTGELNDQLLGKALMNAWTIKNGVDINSTLNSGLIKEFYITQGLTVNEAEYWFDNIYQSAKTSNVELHTFADYFWWFNFCFFWQDTATRLYCLTPKFYTEHFKSGIRKCIHFYNVPDLQLWSINNPEQRKFTKWTEYKKLPKQLIFDLDKNQDYLNNKLKKPSLGNIWLARYIFQGIDSDFNLIKDLDIKNYLNIPR